jgi:hypothetical protein
VGGITELKLILNGWDERLWTGFTWLRTGTGGRALVTTLINIVVP